MATLELKQIRKTYDDTEVIHGVDLLIESGEFCVFVGPSGCGKSTLLRMIAGLEDITAGDVEIEGEVVSQVPAAQRGLAMVFQSYALYPHMTVRQNLSFGLENLRMSKEEIDSRVAEAARMLQIEELLQRRPGQLSGGQRQRVAIGRTVVREPKVFLFDEPLSNLDAKLRVAMRGEIAALHQRLGNTMDNQLAGLFSVRSSLLRLGKAPSCSKRHRLSCEHRSKSCSTASCTTPLASGGAAIARPECERESDNQHLTEATMTIRACYI